MFVNYFQGSLARMRSVSVSKRMALKRKREESTVRSASRARSSSRVPRDQSGVKDATVRTNQNLDLHAHDFRDLPVKLNSGFDRPEKLFSLNQYLLMYLNRCFVKESYQISLQVSTYLFWQYDLGK